MLSESLLAAIYDLVSDEAAMDRFSGVMADELGYRYGMLVIRSPGNSMEVSLNQSRLVMADYAAHYHRLDPWADLAARTPYGQIVEPPDVPGGSLYDSEFYVDFARPIGLVNPVGIRLPIASDVELKVGLNQSLHSSLPTAEDGAKIIALSHHLQRALQLRQELRQAVQIQDTLLSALSRVAFGIVITTADARIEVINAAGEESIAARCGLHARNSILTAADSAMNSALRATIRDACNGGAGGMLRIRNGMEGFTNVLVSPLPAQVGWRQSSSRALVAFRQASAPTQVGAQMLMSAFGLSRGEAQVTVAVLEGRSVEDIAQGRGVKVSTVKTQLQAVFFKTGTSSQRELVLHLLSLPPVLMR